MWGSNNWLCIIDVKNQQCEYSNVAQLIHDLEQLGSDRMRRYEDAADISGLRIARIPRGSEDTAQIEKMEARLTKGNPKQISSIKTWEQLEAGIKREPGVKGFSYYIRVELGGEGSDLSDLRYLVLLMQSIPAVSKKLAVYFWAEGITGDKTFRHYDRLSQFLRFVQIKYEAFYATWGTNIRRLSTEPEISISFFPLMEIDKETYQMIIKPWKLSADYHNEKFDQLFTAIGPIGVEDRYVTTLFQIGLRMFFRTLNGRKYTKKNAKPQLLELLCHTAWEADGISVLDMLLFGILMDRESYQTFGTNEAAEYLSGVKALSNAIAQILENIVNHSEHKKGVFTMRLQTVRDYIQKNYPDYQIQDGEYGLELLIADGNGRDGIVQNFLAGDKVTDELRKLRNEITLADFFQRTPQSPAAQAWERARARSELCLGLLAFASAVEWFHGAVSVRSSPSPVGINDKTYFYHDYLNEEHTGFDTRARWMPGTQFSILFKRTAFRKDIARRIQVGAKSIFHKEHIVYGTTYRDLAWALRYGSGLEPLFPEGKGAVEIAIQFEQAAFGKEGQAKKDAAVQQWKGWFSAKAAAYDKGKTGDTGEMDDKLHYVLLEADLTDFNTQLVGMWEAFCKGLLSSDFFTEPADKTLRYVILLRNMSFGLGEMFYQTLAVLCERIYTETTYVYFYQEREAGGASRYIGATLHESLRRIGVKRSEKPFNLPKILPYPLLIKEGGVTLFERELAEQAEVSILNPAKQGYQVIDTHMRLGNKVHIDSFFEMALFFESPNYAYYTAFLMLERLKGIGLEKFRRILFYGYTSYSRGIVWAAMRIWEEYLKSKKDGEGLLNDSVKMEFAIYQNDLKLESTRSSVQMYYSNKKWLQNPKSIWQPDDKTALIQLVPISSSLTTFNKMLSKLNDETGQQFKPMANLTAFWVRDDFRKKWREAGNPGEPDERIPTGEEEHFWKEVDPERRIVARSSKHDPSEVQVQYLVSTTSYWRNPLSCEKCFPTNPLLEYPLVETDPTSTVPTQQLYREMPKDTVKENGMDDGKAKEWENDCRIANLRGNMLYGHISRGHNHFQYYVQTRQYFQQERDNISDWLSKLPKEKIENEYIDVLVVPKQTSNVEFSQFVYEYYFMGAAESIIVNTEKEFRSNFLAEYNGLFQRLQLEQKGGKKVRFHYVDMAISSGTTFNRAAALVRSLFSRENGSDHPEDNKEMDQRAAFPFESVFLLVSRMSEESKRTYVKDPARQFYAYAELSISNIRTYGDSCVPCKLQQEARLHYHNAATKLVSEYWEKKSIVRAETHFDVRKQASQAKKNQQQSDCDEGYCRMACTHRATAYIKRARGKDTADYFAALKDFFSELLKAVESDQNEQEVSQVYTGASKEPLGWLSAGLKVVVRPFFSFDFKLRCAAMDLYLLLADCLLNPTGERPKAEVFAESKKRHLTQENLDWVWDFARKLSGILERELCDAGATETPAGAESTEEVPGGAVQGKMSYRQLRFIQSHVLKGLTDLKSNYILRRDTMLLVCRQLSESGADEASQDEFFSHYLRSILRLMHTSSDETKSVWLEHLLQFQVEYPSSTDAAEQEQCSDSIEKQINGAYPGVYPAFRRFFDLLLVENNRPLFQGVRDLVRDSANIQGKEFRTEDALKEYYMRNVCQFINLGAKRRRSTDSELARKELPGLRNLYLLLNLVENPAQADNVLDNTAADAEKSDSNDFLARYDSLRNAFQKIVSREETGPSRENQVLLFGKLKRSKDMDIPPYYMISPRLAVDYSNQAESDVVLDHLAERMEREGRMDELEKTGYLLLKCPEEQTYAADGASKEERYDIILILDNNFEAIDKEVRKEYSIQKIEPVYVFLPCGAKRLEALMVVRKILMFRCKLIACLEQDFNNHAIASLSRQRYWAETLGADKVGDHNEHGFMECMQQVLTNEGRWDETDRVIAGRDGKKEEVLKKKRHNMVRPESPEQLERTRHWYLLCAYVNSRISRLYRTYARETNHREYAGDQGESLDQIQKLYARDNQNKGMRPAYNLGIVFFTQIDAGYSRKGYINQMLQVITFHVCTSENVYITHGTNGLDVLRKAMEGYDCVQFVKENVHYAYLAEYLAIIFLDCCISALRANKDWNKTRWGDVAFSTLCEKRPEDRCVIKLSREAGFPVPADAPAFDYLVIENAVDAERSKETRQGPGMSQRAICWYINKLWQFVLGKDEKCPVVEITHQHVHRIKLPILKRK